eukprot:GEMP01017713.1.p1 GENE.GEMP01017713.1~~GEMP01017713.1.p1  ORF type:complete len:130 (-),score=15.96 GEMP01017713.1:451-840(-)
MLQRLIDTRGNITVFIRPAKRSNLKLVQMLIDTHAYVNRTNYTVFHVKMAQRLIDTRAHINRTNGTAFIWSATHDTCENGAKGSSTLPLTSFTQTTPCQIFGLSEKINVETKQMQITARADDNHVNGTA